MHSFKEGDLVYCVRAKRQGHWLQEGTVSKVISCRAGASGIFVKVVPVIEGNRPKGYNEEFYADRFKKI